MSGGGGGTGWKKRRSIGLGCMSRAALWSRDTMGGGSVKMREEDGTVASALPERVKKREEGRTVALRGRRDG